YGEHDITITVRYKDGIRDEIFLPHEVTIFVEEPETEDESGPDPFMIVIPVIAAIGIGFYLINRRKKATAATA
ncbi:MAG: hypothetical protein ACRBB2_08945, partial [Nitrosopumilus sp.]